MAKAKSKIVEALGAATRSGNLGQVIQAAMDKAVLDCLEEGISDPEAHLEAKMKARAKVKAEFKASEKAALEAAAEDE